MGAAIVAEARFNPILGVDLLHWSTGPRFNGAGFVSSDGIVAVLHRSTKRSGVWQLSFFDEADAVGDAEFSELKDALRMVPPGTWALLPVEVR